VAPSSSFHHIHPMVTNDGQSDLEGPRRRLVERARAVGISLEDLSREIGRGSGYLRDYVTRGSPKKLDEDDRRALATLLKVEESALRDGAPAAVTQQAIERGLSDDWKVQAEYALGRYASAISHPDPRRAAEAAKFKATAGMIRALAASENLQPPFTTLFESLVRDFLVDLDGWQAVVHGLPEAPPELGTIPVYGAVQNEFGFAIDRENQIARHARPQTLANVKGAFAVEVWTDEMEPALRLGHIIFVHPTRKVLEGDEALVTFSTGNVALRRFVSRRPPNYKFATYQPDQTHPTRIEDVQRIELIVETTRVRV
jgi:SOS-response transcriptional repressor LexA